MGFFDYLASYLPEDFGETFYQRSGLGGLRKASDWAQENLNLRRLSEYTPEFTERIPLTPRNVVRSLGMGGQAIGALPAFVGATWDQPDIGVEDAFAATREGMETGGRAAQEIFTPIDIASVWPGKLGILGSLADATLGLGDITAGVEDKSLARGAMGLARVAGNLANMPNVRQKPRPEDIFNIDELRNQVERMSPVGPEYERLRAIVDDADTKAIAERFEREKPDILEEYEPTAKTDERLTPEEWQKQEELDARVFDEDLHAQDMSSPVPRREFDPLIDTIEDTLASPRKTFETRFQNMTQEYLERIKDRASEILQDPGVKDISIRMGEIKGKSPAYFNEETNTIWMDPRKMQEGDVNFIADTLTHEIAHRYSIHGMGDIGVAPANYLGGIPGVDLTTGKPKDVSVKRGYTPIGEGKFAEVDPRLVEHREEFIPERAKFSKQEHAFQTAVESLQNDPYIRSVRDRYAQNQKRLQGEEFRRERGLPTFEQEGGVPPALAAPGPSKGISEPADIFRKILTEAKLTRFNKNTLLAELAARDIPIPEELKANIPQLLEELKSRGWVNEKIAGTMTLQVEPPKRIQELKPEGKPEVSTLEEQLLASLKGKPRAFEVLPEVPRTYESPEPKKSKTPNLAETMQEKLTPEEIDAINEILGGQKLPKIKGGTPEEVRLAQEAAKGGKPPSKKLVSAEEKRSKKAFKVTLSDGTEHIVKAPDADAAKTRAEQVLGRYKSTKTVDKVEPQLSTLEKAAKYEIEPQREGFEVIGEELKGGKSKLSLEEKAQEKELKSQLKAEEDFKKAEEKRKVKEARDLEKKKQAEKLEQGFAGDVTDIPKTLKASFDISWPGRQGLFLLNRKVARTGMSQGLLSGLPFKGEEFHLKVRKDLEARPNAELYQKSGLNQFKYDPTQATTIAARSEEFPARQFAEKVPGVKQSERMFLDMGNLARANMFDEFAAKFQRQGKTFENNPELYKGLAEYLNVLTLRKPLPEKLQQAGWLLNKAFFSPMAVYSRLEQMNPYWYYKLPREMQKAALRDVGGTLGAITGLLGGISYAASQAGIEDVEFNTDPAGTHFGRLKVGKTYYDLHGLTPMIRTLYRMVSGRKLTPKGEYALPGSIGYQFQEDLPEAPFGQTAFGELTRFAENKTAPIYQASKGLFTGKDWYGKDYSFSKMLIDLFAPMSLESIGEAGSQYGVGEALKQTPEIIGFSTYTEFPDERTSGRVRGKKKKKLTQPLY